MRIFNLKFEDPQKTLIEAIKEVLPAGIHVAAQFPRPGQTQHSKVLVVEKQDFSSSENSILREYSMRFILDFRDVSKADFENACESLESILSNISENGIKYVELEGMIEEDFDNDLRFRRAYNGYCLVQAT